VAGIGILHPGSRGRYGSRLDSGAGERRGRVAPEERCDRGRGPELVRHADGITDEILNALSHLDGLRGAALLASRRRTEALPLLERARSLAPEAWSDGQLDADELR